MKTIDDLFAALTYEDTKEIIRKCVYSHWKKHGGDLEEMLNEAQLEFTIAYREFDPDKSGFKTWLINRIRWRLLDILKETISKQKYLTQVPMQDIAKEQRDFNLGEFLEGLSEDAKTVVSLVFDSPLDVYLAIKERGDPTRKNVRTAVKEFLSDMGWTANRIRESFKEIRHALSN